MPSLVPTLIPLGLHTATVDPPGECPVCGAEVPTVTSEITARAKDGGRRGNTVDLIVSIASLAVTAQPCGHTIHAWRKDDDG